MIVVVNHGVYIPPLLYFTFLLFTLLYFTLWIDYPNISENLAYAVFSFRLLRFGGVSVPKTTSKRTFRSDYTNRLCNFLRSNSGLKRGQRGYLLKFGNFGGFPFFFSPKITENALPIFCFRLVLGSLCQSRQLVKQIASLD